MNEKPKDDVAKSAITWSNLAALVAFFLPLAIGGAVLNGTLERQGESVSHLSQDLSRHRDETRLGFERLERILERLDSRVGAVERQAAQGVQPK